MCLTCSQFPTCGPPRLRAKWGAEHAIAASGVPYTIFRPTYFMETPPRHIRGRTATVLGRQPKRFHMLAAEDFAAIVSRALSTDHVVNQTLTVYGPEAYTIPAALRIYCDLCAPDVTVASRPLWLMAKPGDVAGRPGAPSIAADLVAHVDTLNDHHGDSGSLLPMLQRLPSLGGKTCRIRR